MGHLRTRRRGGRVEDQWRYRHEDILYQTMAWFAQKRAAP